MRSLWLWPLQPGEWQGLRHAEGKSTHRRDAIERCHAPTGANIRPRETDKKHKLCASLRVGVPSLRETHAKRVARFSMRIERAGRHIHDTDDERRVRPVPRGAQGSHWCKRAKTSARHERRKVLLKGKGARKARSVQEAGKARRITAAAGRSRLSASVPQPPPPPVGCRACPGCPRTTLGRLWPPHQHEGEGTSRATARLLPRPAHPGPPRSRKRSQCCGAGRGRTVARPGAAARRR